MGVAINNSVLGKTQHYMEQARDTAAAIGALLLIEAGLQADDALADHATVAAMLASTNDEATFTNYARLLLPSPTVTVDNPGNRVLMSISGVTPVTVRWDNAGGSGGGVINNVVKKIVFYYDPTPGSSTDAQLIWLSAHDASAQTDGTHLVFTLGTDGVIRARRP